MDEFDIIVVGGGSAGSAAAGRLAESGRFSVCLVEAGGKNNDLFVRTPGLLALMPERSNWAFDTEPMPGLGGRIGYQPRGRGLGGSSAINGMVYIRGNAWDYDNWAALGCTGWGWDDVLPVFRRQEDNARGADGFHGKGGPLHVSDQIAPSPVGEAFVEAATRLQLPRNDDFNGARQEGFGLYQVTQHEGERWSAARAFIDPLKDNPKLSVRTGALVEKIIVEEGRATGVAVRFGNKREVLRARAGVILCGRCLWQPADHDAVGHRPRRASAGPWYRHIGQQGSCRCRSAGSLRLSGRL